MSGVVRVVGVHERGTVAEWAEPLAAGWGRDDT